MLLAVPAPTRATIEALRPRGHVNDFAGVVPPAVRRQLEHVLTELQHRTGAEVAVVTVDSVPDGDIDRAAVDLFAAWGIGRKGKDDGVLILCAVDDRRIRIEIGYGLEHLISDARAGRIVDERILPAARGGDLGTGLAGGAMAVAGIIAADAGVQLVPDAGVGAQRDIARGAPGPGALVATLVFAALMAWIFVRHPLLFLLLLGGGPHRGGGLHRGGFGGGFGGFGGGLSGGGGASRGW